MDARLAQIRGLTRVLIAAESHHGQLLEAAHGLRVAFEQAASFELENEEHRQNVICPQGKAIGPTWAARCIDDYMRTRCFLTGLVSAITDRLQQRPGPVRILYAGCGPFAALVVPLTTIFTPEQLQVEALDIHPASIASLHRLLTTLELGAYFSDIHCVDACSYRLNCPPGKPEFDLLLSETMKAGLAQEPQLAIMSSLGRQLPLTTLFIPEEVQVVLALGSPRLQQGLMMGTSTDACYTDVGEVLCLNRQSIRDPDFPKPRFLTVDPSAPDCFSQLWLETRIQVYREVWIPRRASNLTCHLVAAERSTEGRSIVGGQAHYRPGPNPGIEWQWQYR